MMMTIKQKSDIPTQANPCRTLERAIQTGQLLGDRADPGIVLAHAAQAIQWNQPVLVPVCPPEEMLEQLNADTVKVGDTLENSGSMSFQVNMLNGEAPDACQFPVFTSREAMENGPAASSKEMPLQTVVKMVLDGDNCEGILINPFGPALFLPRQMLEPLSYVRPSSRIYLMEADITKVGADAIVNAANRTLLGGGGVDGAIHRAAGPELLAECRGLHGCNTGEAKVTGAYRLNADCIVHTVGPIYSGSREGAKQLEQCYENSLNAAWERGCQTVAFPSISTGAYGYPIDKAAKIALRTVRNWLWEHPDSFMDVYFCCFSKADLMEYQNALSSLPDTPPEAEWTAKGAEAYRQGDYTTAVRCYKRAAARGDSVALSNLGYCYRVYFFMDLMTAARRGELCALTWADITEHTITISKSRSYVKGMGLVTGTTKNGRARVLSNCELLVSLLNSLRMSYEWNGISVTPQTPVFLNRQGKPLNPDTFSRRIRKVYNRCGLSEQYHLHTLRHFAATLWLQSSISKQVVADALGHGDTAFLERTYCHPQLESKQQAAQKSMQLVQSNTNLINRAKGVEQCLSIW